MVFGFGKKKKPEPEQPVIRPTPSLPQVRRGEDRTGAVGVAWPTSLVDQEELKRFETEFAVGYAQTDNGHGHSQEQEATYNSKDGGPRSGRKISFSQSRNTPFHRPFRPYASMGPNTGSGNNSAPDTPSVPPSAYTNGAQGRLSTLSTRSKTKRPKTAPVFNIMVAGAKGTGKTSLLSLLLSTSDLSPATTLEQRGNLETFLSSVTTSGQVYTPTENIASLQLEILDSPATSVLLTVVDTPGLDFNPGKELVLEGQARAIVREIERRYGESMVEESRVVRTGRGEGFIHLCIYLIDPASITSTTTSPLISEIAKASEPVPPSPTESTSSTSSGSSTSLHNPHDAKKSALLKMSGGDLKILKRLHGKVNILPVIARIDSLTEERLGLVKAAVRRELEDAGIGFGVFGLHKDARGRKKSSTTPATTPTKKRPPPLNIGESPDNAKEGDGEETSENEDDEISPTTPTAEKPKVIKIRSTRPYLANSSSSIRGSMAADIEKPETNGNRNEDTPTTPRLQRSRSHSRIRKAHTHSHESDEEFDLARGRMAIDDEISSYYANGNINEEDSGSRDRKRMSYASMRFYDHARSLRLSDLNESPTAVGAAEREVDALMPFGLVNPEPRKSKKKHHRRHSSVDAGTMEMEANAHNPAMFVRKFRWGTIDVLDPRHCDFVPLRSAVFGSHMKALKHQTKSFYESYRTEKLLIRKARQMGYRDVDGTVDLKRSQSQGADIDRNGVVGQAATMPNRSSKSRERKPKPKDEWVDVAGLERQYTNEIRSLDVQRSGQNGITAH